MNIVKSSKKATKKHNGYHGHVTLEFKNRQGFRERIEHDNDFTEGIEQFLQSTGVFDNSPFANDTWKSVPIYQRLIGGVFLFDNPIEKVDGKYPVYLPGGIKMTANGSFDVSNSTNVTEMGSFNASESSFTTNALTFVYDWGSQMTGDIASISLTSDVGGYIGYGNATSNLGHDTKKNIHEYQSVSSLTRRSYYRSTYAQTVRGNKMYQVENQPAMQITYSERPIPVSAASLFDIDENTNAGNYPILHRVEVPSNVTGSRQSGDNLVAFPGSPGTFVVINKTINSDETVVFGIIDCETEQWTTYSMSETLTNRIALSMTSTSNIDITNDYIALPKEVSGDEYGQLITLPDRKRIRNAMPTSNLYNVYQITPNHIFYKDGRMTDLVSGQTYPTNGNFTGSERCRIRYDDVSKLCLGYGYGQSLFSPFSMRNPLYLATVANLDEVVTKTSDNTMKLIYTVTRKE